MSFIRLLCAVSLIVLASCQARDNQSGKDAPLEELGWRGIPWGSGPSEIRKRFSAPLGSLERDTYERGGTFYRLSGEHVADSRTYKITFFLTPGQKLKSIMLVPKDKAVGCDGLKDDLTDIYGTPLREELHDYVKIYTASWNDERQGVRVSFMNDDRSDTSLPDFCTVEFQPLPTRARTGL